MLMQSDSGWRGEPPRMPKRDLVAAVTRDHGAEPVKARMPARNTLDYTMPDGTRRVRLWQTDVLTFRPDGGIEVDNGTWNTHTTRARLNAFLPKPWTVYTEQGTAHLLNLETGSRWNGKGGAVPFLQRVTINPDGTVTPDQKAGEILDLRKLIDRYIAKARKVGVPSIEDSRGDPWMLRPVLDRETAMDWLESEYWTRTCLALAHMASGMTETGVWYMVREAERRGLDNRDCRRIRALFKRALGLG